MGQARPNPTTRREVEIRQVFEAEDFGASSPPRRRSSLKPSALRSARQPEEVAEGPEWAGLDGHHITQQAKESMQLTPYLTFDGQCEAAFKFYAQCLGGTIVSMLTHGESPMAQQVPSAWRDRICMPVFWWTMRS